MNTKTQQTIPDNNVLALDRTVLANERTYQAWIRTGLSIFATGLGAAKFLKGEMPLWLLMFVVILLLILSVFAFLQAAWRYNHLNIKLSLLDVKTQPSWAMKLISLIFVAISLLSLTGILITTYNG
jgi:putative membrane protein